MWGKGREEVPHLSTTLPRVQSQGMNRAAVHELVVRKVPRQPLPKLASRAKLSEAQKQIRASTSTAGCHASAPQQAFSTIVHVLRIETSSMPLGFLAAANAKQGCRKPNEPAHTAVLGVNT